MPSAPSVAVIHEDYVVPADSECHIILPSLMDKSNFEAQQPVKDPEGSILFYVGFVRDTETIESLVLWDAGLERLGSCALAVEGRAGGQVISDANRRTFAVVQSQMRGTQIDASRRYTLRPLTSGSSWRLACAEHFTQQPVWVYDEDDNAVAHMVFQGSGYQAYVAPNADVCMVIMFLLCCEHLHVKNSGASTPVQHSRAVKIAR